jgi:hypothetical protein
MSEETAFTHTPYPGWMIVVAKDGTIHHWPTYETLTEIQRKSDLADKLANTYRSYREAAETYIGLARVALIKSDPSMAADYLQKFVDLAEEIDGAAQ